MKVQNITNIDKFFEIDIVIMHKKQTVKLFTMPKTLI